MTHARLPIAMAALFLALAVNATACTPEDTAPSASESGAQSPAPVVDSVFPMDVMLARFRADIPEVRSMTGGADDRDALVASVVRALQESDTSAFGSLAVGLAEWAWLYYPASAQAMPPYELPPGLAWLQFQENNRTGVLRALERLGGHSLDYRGYQCDADPAVEGENRVWVGCRVILGIDGGEPAPVRLFSAILERDGRFAFLSFTNDF